MNFDKLPCDIKSKIYNINKIAEKNETFKNSHQTYFNNVLIELLKKNRQNEIIVNQLKLRTICKSIKWDDELYNEVLELQGCETPEDKADFSHALALYLKSPLCQFEREIHNYNDINELYLI